MRGRAAWVTITGLPARLLHAAIGTVVLVGGVYLVTVFAGDLGDQEALLGTAFGGMLALAGLYSYIKAIRKDTFKLTIGDTKRRHDL